MGSQLPLDPHPQLAPVPLKLPRIKAVDRQAEVDAGVGREFLRRQRPWPICEIGRRPDDRHAHFRPGPAGHRGDQRHLHHLA